MLFANTFSRWKAVPLHHHNQLINDKPVEMDTTVVPQWLEWLLGIIYAGLLLVFIILLVKSIKTIKKQ